MKADSSFRHHILKANSFLISCRSRFGDEFRAKRMHSQAGLFMIVSFFVLLHASPAYSQERASIAGTITDSSGAAIPGVLITVTDARTNVVRTTTTNSAGLYSLGDLVPDPYTVSAQAKGFKRAERSAFTLEVAQA